MCQSRPDTKGGFCSFDAVREIGEVASHAYLAIPRTRVECMKTPADTATRHACATSLSLHLQLRKTPQPRIGRLQWDE